MSNEKREQQMMDAADRYADEVCDESCTGAQVAETINDFCAGWRAADSYPNWISVEERLPEKDNEFEDYSKLVVVTDGKDFYKGMYNYGGECWLTHDLWPIEDATYWMEVQLPQSPRKEDKK